MNNNIQKTNNKIRYKKSNSLKDKIENFFKYIHNNVQVMNQSKIFAGLMIIILNIASKFIIIQLPQTVESYLKFTFSRDLLIFAIAWMGTRDIYIALGIVCLFIFVIDFLCNEKSSLCILPENFIDNHVDKLNEMNNTFTPQDLQNIKNLAKKIENEFKPTETEETINREQPTEIIQDTPTESNNTNPLLGKNSLPIM